MFESVLAAVENGGKRQPLGTQLGYTREQAEAIQRLKAARDNHERLGLTNGASKYVFNSNPVKISFLFLIRDEINKAFRRLSVLLHPDKSVAPGSEEAFKILVAARTALLKGSRWWWHNLLCWTYLFGFACVQCSVLEVLSLVVIIASFPEASVWHEFSFISLLVYFFEPS